MSIEWGAITADHVRRACELVSGRRSDEERRAGLVVYSGTRDLPAKEVLREAYRLAKGLTPDAKISFASGEASLNVLRRLGFRAERLGTRRMRDPQS